MPPVERQGRGNIGWLCFVTQSSQGASGKLQARLSSGFYAVSESSKEKHRELRLSAQKQLQPALQGSALLLNFLEKSIHVRHNIRSYLPPSLLSLSPIISSAHLPPIFMSFPKQNKTLRLVSAAHVGLGLGQSVGARESYQCLHPQNRMSSLLQRLSAAPQ